MRILAKNSRASYDYEIKNTYTCGMVLSGSEVKAAKDGSVSLAGSYVTMSPGAASLINCHIGPYKYSPNLNYNPTQARRLLLKKLEIDQLLGKEKGLTLVPLEIFSTDRGLIKLKVGLGKARKKTDKRQYLKKREAQKEIREHT